MRPVPARQSINSCKSRQKMYVSVCVSVFRMAGYFLPTFFFKNIRIFAFCQQSPPEPEII